MSASGYSRQPSLGFSDSGDEKRIDSNGGDYSTRMSELFDDDDDDDDTPTVSVPRFDFDADDDDDDEEAFVYDGADAELREVLDDEDEHEEHEVERSLLHDLDHPPIAVGDEALVTPSHLYTSPSSASASLSSPPIIVTSLHLKTFLHPTISRLRSYTPNASPGSSATSPPSACRGVSPVPSSFSTLSPGSSSSHLPGAEKHDLLHSNGHVPTCGSSWPAAVGTPTVLAANGLVCVGMDNGRIFVFDFKQTLKCVCGDPAKEKTVGAVTALALSHDHTFVAAGHATGHIQLFDLKKPQVPARFVLPTTLAAVGSGRKEGHLEGSRIVNIGFVAGRHTAIVTADHTGLAFYHSLGKALFFEASDVLRILGKYPNEEIVVPGQAPFHRRRARRTNTILAMAPLPLGTVPHPTDTYNVTALLTAAKLVIVGLKPSPKTWYRKHRNEDDDHMGKAKFRAAMAWYPSVVPGASANRTKPEPSKKDNGKGGPPPTTPMCERTGKLMTVEVGRLVFEEKAQWAARDNVHAIQWLNAKQILAVTTTALEVYDVNTRTLVEHAPFDPTLLVSPTIAHTINGAFSYSDATGDIAHSVRTYKGKIFLLGRHEMQVGTLLTWADRILSFVESGDFLSAIDLTRSYYLGIAPGNKNGLPDDPLELKKVVGEKMRELMVASTRYTFSEDRMTDATHRSPDGRGVDRTSLFENLVATCARACIALGDLEFLFEDLFQAYDDAGIAPIYLEQFETFVLEHDRLIALHAANGRPDRAERVIWHIDPAVQLCQTHHLYDALMYVYTRAMRDYVAPVVEMLRLIRKVTQLRRSPVPDEAALEPLIVNAYKVYPYLADALSGLTYPSEEPLDEDEATEAKRDLYAFLFHGRSSTWPRGDGGRLILTAEEDGGVEPTYPYCRLLLTFDAEAFLHALDLAFEDTYLNDEKRGGASRLVIVKILLEILASPPSSPSSSNIPSAVRTFVHIFVARNVPKYPQFIQMSPSVLHGILVGLATDADRSTREDRQLAAEYLLSTYTPHESEQLLHLFEEAGFYRILRTWHRQENRWAPLLLAHIHDPDIHPADLFASADDIFVTASRSHEGTVPEGLRTTVADALPDLLHFSVIDTARFLDRHVPQLHDVTINLIISNMAHERFAYLRCLLGPPSLDDEQQTRPGPSTGVPPRLRRMYIELLCKIEPSNAIPSLQYLPADFLEWDEALRTCEEQEVFDAVVWALNWRGNPSAALQKAETFGTRLSTKVGLLVAQGASSTSEREDLQQHIESLEAIGRTAVAICVERSSQRRGGGEADVSASVEDLWFQLLHTQITSVQAVSACCPADSNSQPPTRASDATHAPLVSASAGRGVSFPRLFTRLVETTSAGAAKGGATPYMEFRTILTGMMEAYRAEGDMLAITKHLLDRDVFETVELAARARGRGWAPRAGTCAGCRRPWPSSSSVWAAADEDDEDEEGFGKITIMRTGIAYHGSCLPPQLSSNVH
ncbi:Golgi CORVET complex core vacuolar protein 8-domain-containing protein [Lactarius quietus]|nr:Golgi CORVET complex core vacuolar protein 8-domain-containing protein [Lactarius quietus]